MKKYLIFFILFSIGITGFSQEEGEGEDKVEEKNDLFGVDKNHFVHGYINVGFMLPPEDAIMGADILYGKSHTFTYGVRYKYKVAGFFALGAGLNYTYQAWHLDQNNSKVIPDTMLFDKEKILTNNLGVDAYIRFNIGKQKNSIGNYIDLGGYGEWAFSTKREVTINSESPNDPVGYEYLIGSYKHLNYLEKINYGLSTRLAYGRYVLFGKYRLSDMFTPDFKSSVSTVEMPRLIVGLEIGLHK